MGIGAKFKHYKTEGMICFGEGKGKSPNQTKRELRILTKILGNSWLTDRIFVVNTSTIFVKTEYDILNENFITFMTMFVDTDMKP